MSAGEFIPYSRQTIEDDDIQAVSDVLRSPYLTTGPKVKEFEQTFAKYVGSPQAVAFSSGTAALHAAMFAAGIAPGDEVLVPTMSFAASANAVLYVGAKPIFVDSLPDGFNLDPSDVVTKITPRTKAIVVVHFAGQPVDLETIHRLAREHRLLVIEDAAHALGAEYQGKKIGSLSDMTIFSFHPVKHITTGEGGMVTTANLDFVARLRRFRHHGINVDVIQRDAAQQWSYDMVDLGYNYRLTDIQCALGISQLRKSERFLSERERVARAYKDRFASVDYLTTPPEAPAKGRHSWHLYVVRLDTNKFGTSRDAIFQHLRQRGIGVHVHYRPIHLHPYYRALGWKAGDCPTAERVFERMLSLPIFPSLTEAMIDRVTQAIAKLPASVAP